MVIFGLILFFLLSVFFAWMVIKQRQEIRAQSKLMALQSKELQHQHELWEGNLMAQESERQRIAAQLHDEVCAKLGVLHLTFHRLRRTEPDQEEYVEMCSEINDLVGDTLSITRRISHELVPPTLEGFGLVEALEEWCEQVRNTGATDIRFHHNLQRNDLGDVNTELNLFRVVQELTNNTLKHAEASFITIDLHKEEEVIQLQYCDNGVGFDPNNMTKGLGLKNIFNRARMIGASLDISTAPEQGFEIKLAIPVLKES